MWVRFFSMLSALVAAASTLPNGIHVYDPPASKSANSEVEVFAGYRSGIRNDGDSSGNLAAVVSEFLKSTPSARSIALTAYGSGGSVETISDLERTGIRVRVPAWAGPAVMSTLPQFLSETPQKHPELVDRAIQALRMRQPSSEDVQFRVEEQLRAALLGSDSRSRLHSITRTEVEQFFAKYYGTDRAFVITTADTTDLKSVPRRNSLAAVQVTGVEKSHRDTAITDLHLDSDLDEGAVLLGIPSPSIYYRNWYATLMLDRLLQRVLPEKPRTVLKPSLEPYFYSLQVPVSSGSTAAAVESNVRDELNRIQFVRAADSDLEAARQDAIRYLESDATKQWFTSLDVPERRLEGLDWIKSFSAEDMRSAARDLVEAKPVVMGWSPKLRVLRLQVESLSQGEKPKVEPPQLPVLSDVVRDITFPAHHDPAFVENSPIRLQSGVSAELSTTIAVFVAPDSMRVFEKFPDLEMVQKEYGAFRSNRILVLAPPSSFEAVKEVWSRFHGNDADPGSVLIHGKVTSAYTSALLAVKMILDRRLIESGLWDDVRLNIRAVDGAFISIHGTDSNRMLVTKWLDEIAAHPLTDSDLNWAREAAVHHLQEFQMDLQSLAWEWNSIGVLTDIHLVSPLEIQDAAKLCLESL